MPSTSTGVDMRHALDAGEGLHEYESLWPVDRTSRPAMTAAIANRPLTRTIVRVTNRPDVLAIRLAFAARNRRTEVPRRS